MKVRYDMLSFDDRKEIDSYVIKSISIDYTSLKSFKWGDKGKYSYNKYEELLKKYKEFLYLIENRDVFDYLKFVEFKRTAPDDADVWEDFRGEVLDYVEEQIEKYETEYKKDVGN